MFILLGGAEGGVCPEGCVQGAQGVQHARILKMSNFWCIKYINLSLQVSEAPHGDLNLKGQGAVFLFLRDSKIKIDSGNRALGSSSGLEL